MTIRTPITLVLDRLRSAHNTGNIFRLAEAVAVQELITCGYTPTVGHPKLAKTAMGAEFMVPTRAFADSLIAVQQLKKEGFKQIIAIEPSDNAPGPWDFDWQFPSALVLGNEALGIQNETLKECTHWISLPMLGQKESINVGNCAAVVLYGGLRAWQKNIIKSKDGF